MPQSKRKNNRPPRLRTVYRFSPCGRDHPQALPASKGTGKSRESPAGGGQRPGRAGTAGQNRRNLAGGGRDAPRQDSETPLPRAVLLPRMGGAPLGIRRMAPPPPDIGAKTASLPSFGKDRVGRNQSEAGLPARRRRVLLQIKSFPF